jgi:hypothetical protein
MPPTRLLPSLALLATVVFTPLSGRTPPPPVGEPRLAPALEAPRPEPTDGPVIKLALLLDTSNSMDGLINQARTRLWTVVNELGAARVEGRVPQLQVALFHYGNNDVAASSDYVELRCPFTTDLDIVSEQLFGLSTHGGAEYCGAAIREAVRQLDWSHPGGSPVLRVIVIAGNEPFNQGSEPFAESIATARGLGVRVNTIYCGDREEGRRTFWAEGARKGQGHYAAIDQNRTLPEIETPFDEALQRLNDALNGTYLGYGRLGRAAKSRQVEQDAANVALSPSASLSRVEAKTTVNYTSNAAAWDLVSATESGQVDLAALADEALPEELRGRTPAEREAYLRELAAERARLEAEIRELSARRGDFLAEARREGAARGPDLDDALLAALRGQAGELGFVFGE